MSSQQSLDTDLLVSDDPSSPISAYASGSEVFARLFSRWMDSNGWSHPTMTSLAAACLGGKGWLHSSQISGLRHAQTRNPGPRTFVAIERLNYYIWRYANKRELLPNTKGSNAYQAASPILEDGKPPGLGWFVEVFCGYRIPKDIQLDVVFIQPDKVEDYCAQLARLLRKQLAQQDFDLVDDLSVVLHRHYPTHEVERVERITDFIRGEVKLNKEELEQELLCLSKLSGALGGPGTEQELLEALA